MLIFLCVGKASSIRSQTWLSKTSQLHKAGGDNTDGKAKSFFFSFELRPEHIFLSPVLVKVLSVFVWRSWLTSSWTSTSGLVFILSSTSLLCKRLDFTLVPWFLSSYLSLFSFLFLLVLFEVFFFFSWIRE